jgi:hypothetical protein
MPGLLRASTLVARPAPTIRQKPHRLGLRTRGRNEMTNRTGNSSSIVWEGATYPRISPGIYQGFCVGWQGPEQLRAFRKRWSIRLEFSLLAEEQYVSGFFNLGSGTRPHIGSRSRFYRVWTMANGDTPCKGQQMTLDTLTEPWLLYTVQVADGSKDEHQSDKPDALIYSKVVEVLRVERK